MGIRDSYFTVTGSNALIACTYILHFGTLPHLSLIDELNLLSSRKDVKIRKKIDKFLKNMYDMTELLDPSLPGILFVSSQYIRQFSSASLYAIIMILMIIDIDYDVL